jgi:hypothetical protein
MIYHRINTYINSLKQDSFVSRSHWELSGLYNKFGRERVDSILYRLWKSKEEKKAKKELAFCREWVHNLLSK